MVLQADNKEVDTELNDMVSASNLMMEDLRNLKVLIFVFGVEF